MKYLAALLPCAILMCSCSTNGGRVLSGKLGSKETRVTLDGEGAIVYFSDGDTFKVVEGPMADKRARLEGFNALESYGPVHRWGDWTTAELYNFAKKATRHAQRGTWNCVSRDESGGYGRILVYCEDLAVHLLKEGLAHVFSVENDTPRVLLDAQNEAITHKKGMWKKGVPEGLVTSLHSADEGRGDPYNRVVQLSTGLANKRPHSESYDTCSEVCLEGSCMVYVPYKLRYGPDRARCIR